MCKWFSLSDTWISLMISSLVVVVFCCCYKCPDTYLSFYLNMQIKVLMAMKISDQYCMRSLSSQEDGGGSGSSWSVLPKDSHESATALDRADAVCGDVSGNQYFYILQWLLQQTRGHVSRKGLYARRDEDLWTKCSSTTKEQNKRDGSRPLSLSVYHITTLGLTWIHDPDSRGPKTFWEALRIMLPLSWLKALSYNFVWFEKLTDFFLQWEKRSFLFRDQLYSVIKYIHIFKLDAS